MKGILKISLLVMVFATLGSTHLYGLDVCGFKGLVYNHNSNLAGSELDTIIIVKFGGVADYNYTTATSYWHCYCETDLTAGTWAAMAVTYESGTYYYSSWKVYTDWTPHNSTAPHNFYCTLEEAPGCPIRL